MDTMHNSARHPHSAFLSMIDAVHFRKDFSVHQGALLRSYLDYTDRAFKETEHKEYCDLQMTWNYQVLIHTSSYALGGAINRDRMISLGSFLGLMEMAYAGIFTEVVCVDQHNFMPSFKPENILFHLADLDSSTWALPDKRFNICFMVEILEHLLWSPVPLLKWIHAHCEMLAITTPDDNEWPQMTIRPYTRYQHFDAIPSAYPGATGNPTPMFHCKQYSQSEFIELLTFCGFRLIEFRRIGLDSKQMLAICTPAST